MGLDEERSAALAVDRLHDLPGVLLVLLGIRTDERDGLVAEMAGRPDWTVLRMGEVGAAPGMRGLAAGLDDANQLVVLGIDDRDLVARVRRNEEVATGLVETTVMQEALGFDRRHLQI